MTARIYNVLFLCTANSARSILAESTLNHLGRGRFRGFSAGSFPGGKVNPMALEVLAAHGLPTDGARSKSWDEFAGADAPLVDIVITVCDNAAGEICPIWPGHPVTAHWGIEDPAAVEGDGKRAAFETALGYLTDRIERLLTLPIASLDATALKARLREIGSVEGATAQASAA